MESNNKIEVQGYISFPKEETISLLTNIREYMLRSFVVADIIMGDQAERFNLTNGEIVHFKYLANEAQKLYNEIGNACPASKTTDYLRYKQ